VSDTKTLLEAMLAVQAEAPTLKKDATNPHFKSKYAPLDTIVETIGPILARHGLVWSTKPSFDETTGEPTLKYRLAHAPSKEFDEGEMKLLLSKGDPQGQGSAITYARRYALVSVLNLVADDEDDGNAASQGQRAGYGNQRANGGKPASDKQIALVRRLFTQKGATAAEASRLLATAGVTVGEGESPRDACARLQFPGVSQLIEFLKENPVPTGVSDVPSDASEFTHPPAGQDPDLEPGPGQFDVGPS
jgi:hypothetical protein